MRILRQILLAFRPRLILALYLGNLLLAMVPVMILSASLTREAATRPGVTLRGDDLAIMAHREPGLFGRFEGVKSLLSFSGLEDPRIFFRDGAVSAAIVSVSIIYALFWTFMAGGILVHFRSRKKVQPAMFGANALRLFPGNLLLSIVHILAAALLYTLIVRKGGALLADHFDPGPSQILYLIVHWIPVALCIITLILLKIGIDFGRTALAAEERRSAVVCLAEGFATGTRNLGASLLYFFALGVITAGLWLIQDQLQGIEPGFWPAVAVGQLFIVARIWITLAWWKGLTYLRSIDEVSL